MRRAERKRPHDWVCNKRSLGNVFFVFEKLSRAGVRGY